MSEHSKSANKRPLIKMADLNAKQPPQALDLEDAVLGAALLEPESLETLFEVKGEPEVFYKPAHQKIYAAMKRLYDTGNKVDLLTVTALLGKTGELEMVGGAFYLTKIMMAVVSSAHIDAHARIVMEKYLKREQIRVGAIMMKNGFDETADAFETLEQAEMHLYELSTSGVKKKADHISVGVKGVMKRMHEQMASNVDFTGLNTGYPKLNDVLGGWQKTNLIIVAARPSVGKTAFTMSVALNCVLDKQHGGPVAMFNLEMGVEEIVQRQLANISGVLMDHINKPKKYEAGELEKVIAASNQLAASKIYVDDTAGLTLSEFRSKARNLVRKQGVKLIILDYLQLMELGDGNKENREQEISKISRGLKKLAKDLEVPVIALSQMNRGIDTQKRPPELSDLRESGAIEQDADLVMFLYRPSPETIKDKPHLKGKVLGSIKKHRNGESDVDVVFEANNRIQRWTEYDPTTPQVVSSESFQQVKSTYQVAPLSFSFGATGTDGIVDDLPF